MASRYSVAAGDWGSTSVWSATDGGASGASVPSSSDDVIIHDGSTVLVSVNESCKTLVIENSTLQIADGAVLDCFGTVVLNNGATLSNSPVLFYIPGC